MKEQIAALSPEWGHGNSNSLPAEERVERFLRRAYNKDGPEVFIKALSKILIEAEFLGTSEPTASDFVFNWKPIASFPSTGMERFIVVKLTPEGAAKIHRENTLLSDPPRRKAAGEPVIVWGKWATSHTDYFTTWCDLPGSIQQTTEGRST